jgi:hypothetical protein
MITQGMAVSSGDIVINAPSIKLGDVDADIRNQIKATVDVVSDIVAVVTVDGNIVPGVLTTIIEADARISNQIATEVEIEPAD